MASLGPKLQFLAVDLTALNGYGKREEELAKVVKELVLAAMRLPGGGPRVFLRPALPVCRPQDLSCCPVLQGFQPRGHAPQRVTRCYLEL